jgi:platelet-activating factor acetylhydrolase
MYWQSNFDKVMSLMKEATEQGAPAFLCTVRGAIHISQSDFSLLYRHVCSFFLKATVHPERAIDLNIRYATYHEIANTEHLYHSSASLEFLRDVTSGAGKTIIERCLTDEKLLQANILEQIPDVHKPEDEFIAKGLKVKHEFRTRVAATVQRKLKRTKRHGFYNPGDEMWMHFKPELEQLRAWREKNNTLDDSMDEGELREEAVEPGSEETETEFAGHGASSEGSSENW